MSEILSPKLSKQMPPNVSRLQSPTNLYFLGSNNVPIERAEARAARASAVRRKPMAAAPPPPPFSPSRSGLTNDQIMELFQNCIKLAAENKINQRNTWELKLIDHLSEIIKVETENDAETNFQKASCSLEAGVRIYSIRVDSVHSEAYRMLGRINRAGGEKEIGMQDSCIDAIKDDQQSRKTSGLKVSPLSTLEQSFETLNLKKFDVAFAVDPLYHHMSAHFDEGDAKGLLLSNLGVYGVCQVLFDSAEVPGTFTCSAQNCNVDTVNISFAREDFEQMVKNVLKENEISPSLDQMLSQLAKCRGTLNSELHEKPKSPSRTDLDIEDEVQQNAESSFDMQVGSSDWEEESCVVEENFSSTAGTPSINQAGNDYLFGQEDMNTKYKEFLCCFFPSTVISPNQNVWAGPDYWKYTKPTASDVHTIERRSGVPRRSKSSKANEFDINFSESLDFGQTQIFAPPENGKSSLLPHNREIQSNKLPEDSHYQPEDLVKLFLLPNVFCFRKVGKKLSDVDSSPEYGFHHQMPSSDNESACSFGDQYNDTHVGEDAPHSNVFVPHAHQAKKIEIRSESTSKQVDIHLLKDALWNHMQEYAHMPEFACEVPLSFKNILATIPRKHQVVEPENITPHLCFICLLHLANEHGFCIQDCPHLDDLLINIPRPLECK